MDKTICGHDRDVLIWALSLHTVGVDTGIAANVDRRPNGISQRYYASEAIHEPAKLAEMLAERGRELGFAVNGDVCDEKQTYVDIWNNVHGTIVWQSSDPDGYHDRYDWTMPQARAILLQWLQLPDGAREEAEKVLRGET